MCGIFAYKGKKDPIFMLLTGLFRLEYRGYDSAGLFVVDEKGNQYIKKAVGAVEKLKQKIYQDKVPSFVGEKLGIAHTRRATHGGVLEKNTHPHHSQNKKFWVVHNGIIENFKELRDELKEKAYKFYSDTDTEVVAALLEIYWNGNFLETVKKVISKINGAFALIIISKENPGEMIAVKWGSPLIFGLNGEEFFFASDKQALAGLTKQIIFLSDGDLIYIKGKSFETYNQGQKIKKQFENLNISISEINKKGYETFMLKEIFEQAEIIKRNFEGRINFEKKDVYSNSFEDLKDKQFKKINLIACGTSYNAAQIGAMRLNNIANIQAQAFIASEYIYQKIIVKDTLHVFISQSGETADTLEVLKVVKKMGGMTFGIVNVVGSSIATLTDCGLFIRAGVEIGVASTKAFSAQLVNLMFLVLFLAKQIDSSWDILLEIIEGLQKLPDLMQKTFEINEQIKKIAKNLVVYKNFFFLGRSYLKAIADESSLKFKEISYLHSESYPAGELKHGPLALIDENFPSILFAPSNFLYHENISSFQEIKTRKGKVLWIGDKKNLDADRNIVIPSINFYLSPFLAVIVGQLLAYHVAKNLGRNIDKPRNLAKSVTVK